MMPVWLRNSLGFKLLRARYHHPTIVLVLRGLKTLHLRMERHQLNAQRLVKWLDSQDRVKRVLYPRFGGMISFTLDADLEAATRFVTSTEIFTLAESLGGVESLIGVPAVMTHASVPTEVRRAIGIEDGLIRLSVGIEHIDDLILDLTLLCRKRLQHKDSTMDNDKQYGGGMLRRFGLLYFLSGVGLLLRKLRMSDRSANNIREASEKGPVVYVFYTRSKLDWLALNRVLNQRRLPRLRKSL